MTPSDEVRAIPAERINRYIRRHLAQPADIGPHEAAQLGDEWDTTGSGGMYDDGWTVHDQITSTKPRGSRA